MKIFIDQLKENGFSMRFDNLPFPTAEDERNWSQIAGEILLFAFLDRSGWLIFVEPQDYSLITDLSDGEQHIKEKVGDKEYIFSYQEKFTAELLNEIAADDDFSRALLWIMSAGASEKTAIYKIIRAMDESKRFKASKPTVENEWLFAGFDYAETIYWYNPPFQSEQIFQKLNLIVNSYNYELVQNQT